MKSEAEIAVMLPQTKEHLVGAEAGKARDIKDFQLCEKLGERHRMVSYWNHQEELTC